MKKRIPVDQAVGMVLPHDITEIVQGEFKGCAFKKGHILRLEDVEHLRRLGKEHIYALELSEGEIHENEAARLLAAALAGEGVEYSDKVNEGKASLRASYDGLLKIDKEALYRFNLLGEIMCSTLHTDTPVKKGEQVAATRLIPLVGERSLIAEAVAIATSVDPVESAKAGEPAEAGVKVIRVLPLKKVKAGLVVTGSEVYYGRIEDKFEAVLREKMTVLG
ncbi:MAG: molybdopterin-binding protein, partial [Candidatus Electrothrix sp.]